MCLFSRSITVTLIRRHDYFVSASAPTLTAGCRKAVTPVKIRTNVRSLAFCDGLTMSASSTTRAPEGAPPHDSRFDRRLAEILDYATEVFADKGYEGASMRDLSRLSGISLAGLYYYFESKEKLLYIIQRHTFSTIVDRLRERLAASSDPEERIRIFVQNHVEYSVAKQKALKVLSHEDDVLKNSYGAELAAIKREYYRICVSLVEDVAKGEGAKPNFAKNAGVGTRTAVMGLFGMMNWLYTWYNPRVDPAADVLAREISDIFLSGVRGDALTNRSPRGSSAALPAKSTSQRGSLARSRK
jgi:TetR/AcrR family transcriptional regulator, cholesterol catabolism regulator